MSGMSSKFGMATVCRQGYHPNPSWKKGRGQRQCLKTRPKKEKREKREKRDKMTLEQLQRLAARKGITATKSGSSAPLKKSALKAKLTRNKIKYSFGMATVCAKGYHPNPDWKKGRGQRQCLRDPDSVKHRVGMATVCPRGYHINTKWKKGRGQRQCLRDPDSVKHRDKMSLEALQSLAKSNGLSISKREGGALNKAALKAKLTRHNIMYI